MVQPELEAVVAEAEAPEAQVPAVQLVAPELVALAPAVRALGAQPEALAPEVRLGAWVLEALPVLETPELSGRLAALASKPVQVPASPRLQALPATHGCTLRSEPCALRVETPL